MKAQAIFAFAALSVASLVSASPLLIRQDGGFIHLPMAVRYYGSNHSCPNGTVNNNTTVQNNTNPSSGPVPVSIKNDLFSYEVLLGIGDDPSQQLTLQLDTGSSDIWVYGPGSCKTCLGGVCE